MNESSQEKDSIVSRIEKLELQNRRLKRGALAILVVIAPLGLMGQAQRKPTRPPAPPPAPILPANIEAQSFVLKDGNGHARAELSMGGTGPNFKLLDQTGSALVTLSLIDGVPGGPVVLLSDPEHRAGLSMSVLGGAGSQLTLSGERPDIQAHIGVTPDGTTLALSDQDGFTANIGSGIQPSKGGQMKKTTAASITLFNKDRKVLWTEP